ncbi:MAG: L-aspartate oxidase [Pirellulales bacterium]|jgi:L-aspartate oxidase|nr:L-aspartate oxidase [Thermoguttaceae bacterium]MDD4786281.1 L-aspartate oxidase [Pirellulales bacterium]NLZ00864.1 L-aspartate oxidase [Pirellulaceae bacterium]
MSISTARYLASFHPKKVPHFFTDILVVGGGLAGMRAALEAAHSLSVLVVTKDGLQASNSAHAQGGIAAVLGPEDRFEDHAADTLIAGGALCDPEVVRSVVEEAPRRIVELVEWGTKFDQIGSRLALTREGGHRHNRIVHALGDATGKEVMRAVTERVLQTPNISIWQNTFLIDLVTDNASCVGALVWNRQHGKTLIWAKQTILATGGAGQIYRETTNPEVATGDGLAVCYRAGAELRDLEFMQFHPTVLYMAGSSRHLITEAIRGEGAHLIDRHGDRFMLGYDARAELAPRDIVSRAIVAQMEKTRHPNVYLDLTHLDPQRIRGRFPGITALCAGFGLDITRDRIPVRPGAHYMMGGVTVDCAGRTTLPHLWAVGEVASTGLHGGNRLASNSLSEAAIYGARAGQAASQEAAKRDAGLCPLPLENPQVEWSGEPLDIADIRNSLKSLMWRACGVQRDGQDLAEAATDISGWCRYVLARQFSNPIGWELQNMLTLASLMIEAASLRAETRGGHVRTDYPDQDDVAWNHHLCFHRDGAPSSKASPDRLTEDPLDSADRSRAPRVDDVFIVE